MRSFAFNRLAAATHGFRNQASSPRSANHLNPDNPDNHNTLNITNGECR